MTSVPGAGVLESTVLSGSVHEYTYVTHSRSTMFLPFGPIRFVLERDFLNPPQGFQGLQRYGIVNKEELR